MTERSEQELMAISMETPDARFLTVKQFSRIYPWPSESALRAYIYRAQDLGLSDAFFRVGRRVLVAPSKFFVLIKELEKNRVNRGGVYEKASFQERKAHV